MNPLNKDEKTQDKNLLAEVMAFVEEHLSLFPRTELSIFLVNEKGKYSPTLCKIEVRPNDSNIRKDQDLDYGHVRLIRFYFPTERLGTYLDSIVRKKTIKIPAIGEIALSVRSSFQTGLEMKSRYIHKYSHERWMYAFNDWPYYLLSIQLDEQSVNRQQPLLKKGMPAYAQYDFAVTDFFNIPYPWQFTGTTNIFVVIPDPRARIEHLQLTGNLINISLIRGSSRLKDLLIKLFAKKGEEIDSEREFTPKSDQIALSLRFEPEFVSVYLLENKSGDELDWKQIDMVWGSKSNGADVGSTEDSLIQWIERGEGENVEFKEKIDESSPLLNFKKTVTAFSNTNGGLIYVGINDEGVAAKDCDLKDETITQYVMDVEPPPNISFHRISVNGKRILVVKVEEGKDKPYNLRDHGFFIRRGKTNSRAGRLEIQKFFEQVK